MKKRIDFGKVNESVEAFFKKEQQKQDEAALKMQRMFGSKFQPVSKSPHLPDKNKAGTNC